jgi:adenosylcobinamide kinase/adenosylcobinamide-phosphate guanylyltransferase
VLGGERSGKSDFAQRLAPQLGEPVLFVATAEARDPEMAARIERHRASRPPHWTTLEATRDVGRAIRLEPGDARTILVDCLTLLVSNCLEAALQEDQGVAEAADAVWPLIQAEALDLVEAAATRACHLILVSNEVGMGLVPPYPSGRVYRDLLGRANQLLASLAHAVYLMVAGIPVDVKALARPIE